MTPYDTPNDQSKRSRRLRIDMAMVAGLAAAWVLIVALHWPDWSPVTADSFRDLAYIENIVAGRLWQDPSLRDLPYWYPPGLPALMAALVRLTGASPAACCAASIFFLNGLIPIALYVLVRQTTRSAGALICVLAGLTGSWWWATRVASPMPSIQSAVLGFAALAGWVRGIRYDGCRGGWSWAGAGLALGLAAWCHLLTALVMAATIVVHGTAWAIGGTVRARRASRRAGTILNDSATTASRPEAPPGGDKGSGTSALARPSGRAPAVAPLKGIALVMVVGSVISIPLWVHFWRLPIRNPVPMQFFAQELAWPRLVLCLDVPLLVPLGVAGLVLVTLRGPPAAWWAPALAGVGLIGQASGYARHYLGWPTPIVTPHQFQWYTQLALGVLGGYAVVEIVRLAAAHLHARHRSDRPATLVAALLAAALVGPGLWHFGDMMTANWTSVAPDDGERPLYRWIRGHTQIDDVIACEPWTAYHEIAALTGRKVVVLPAGFCNFSADYPQRAADNHELLHTKNPRRFRALADQHQVGYVLIESAQQGPAYVSAQSAALAGWGCVQVYQSPDRDRRLFRVPQ